MKARVLVTESLDQDGLELLREQCDVDVKTGLSPEDLLEIIPDYEGLIVRSATQVTADVIRAGRQLKVVGRAGVGVNNIDLDTASQLGIVVLNVPDGNTTSACEHAFGLMLALARNIPAAHASLTGGAWERKAFMGHELYGKTLGIVGFGRIGQEVAKRARAFGMEVLCSDPYVSEDFAGRFGARLLSLEELLPVVDILTLHTPLTPATRNLIGTEELAQMKPGALLINAARGGIVNEEALAQALTEGPLAGAALDVFTQEPPAGSPLLALPNVVVTPHLGASTREAQKANSLQVAEQVGRFLAGQPVRNAVNLPSFSEEDWETARPLLPLAEILGNFFSQALPGPVSRVELHYTGPLSGKALDAVAHTALAGLLAPLLDQPVNQVNAPFLAEQKRIELSITRKEAQGNGQVLELRVGNGGRPHHVRGAVLPQGEARLTRFDGMLIDLAPTRYMLLTEHQDKPGIIGKVGTLLGDRGVNIASMQVGRTKVRGHAVMILAIDDPVDDATLHALREIPDVGHVRLIHLPSHLIAE